VRGKDRNGIKKPIKFVEVGNSIWNTFDYCNFFQISTDFEIFKRFQVKSSLTELCSLSLMACLIANRSGLPFGHRVLRCDRDGFLYRLVDMHNVIPNIHEVMAFPNRLSVKENQQKLRSLESVLYSSFWTLETNTSLDQHFM
jgi:hypothetical protein